MRLSPREIYYRLTIGRPLYAWIIILAVLGLAIYHAKDFRLDASADSLVLENDADLNYYRTVSDRYGSAEFLIVTYTPEGDLFSDATLARLGELRDELAALPWVAGVTSILDVPLIDSPRMSLGEVQRETRTLLHPDTDREMARREFATSPIYRSLLTDPDGETTAIQVNLRADHELEELTRRRDELRLKREQGALSEAEADALQRFSQRHNLLSAQRQDQLKANIAQIRGVLDRYRDSAQIHLGGVPMIASDMIDFVRADIRIFSLVVGGLLILLLAIAFRRLRWVLVPAAICVAVSAGMVGLLGFMDWRVTVVSSNFTSLTLIITLSLTVHLIVRQLELHAQDPSRTQAELLRQTLSSKLAPSIYTTATTMVSFASLIIADVRPVIDFGLMMVCSVGIAFVLTFALYPALLARLAPGKPSIAESDITARITAGVATGIERHGLPILLVYGVLVVGAAVGITRIGVENRFIDYFKSDTEIYQGMVLIDRELGGTTPLDVILEAPAEYYQERLELKEMGLLEDDGGLSGSSYWYNIFQLEMVQDIHDYLDGLPETGKVLSMASTMDMMTMLNDDEELNNFVLAVMHGRLPKEVKAQLFDPYMSEDGNQIRFAIRVIDSDQNLRRDALLKKIRMDLTNEFKLKPEQLQLTGLLVLYNNVLQSLFRSQILTLALVFVAIVVMLWMLFRSLFLAVIGVAPTMFAAAMILGLMGWLGIPLDIMTITIAAITIGIGVDNTIHYTHRFKSEIEAGASPLEAMRSTHGSVGRAIYYTSVTVTLGFSFLALSNFVPIIYFGLFTGLAMLLALMANLTLLPLLLLRLNPIKAPIQPA